MRWLRRKDAPGESSPEATTPSADDLLRAAGWRPGRHVGITELLPSLRADGYTLWRSAEEVLSEFAMLSIILTPPHSVDLDPAKATAGVDPAWVSAYAEVLGVRLVPVGSYSQLLIMYGEDGQFYGGFDHDFGAIGGTMHDVIEGILLISPPKPLDRQLPPY